MKALCLRTLYSGTLGLSLIANLGCSPAPDPVGKGRMAFSVTYPDATLGKVCGLPDIGGVGDPPPDLPNPDDTVDGPGEPVVDGQSVGSSDSGEYQVKCTVTKSGRIAIDMLGPNHSSTTSSPQSRGEAGIEVIGSLSTSDGEGRGNISVRTVLTGAMTSQGSDTCTLTALKDSDGDPAVGAGSAAFAFECPHAVSSYDQFGGCATRGTVIVEDCLEK